MSAETPEKLAEYKLRSGYRQPPPEMDPPKGTILGRDQAWTDLVSWLEDNTDDWHGALLVYLAERYKTTISDAYMATDSYAKSKLGMRGYN